jgi:hypothetical protein
MFELNFLYWVTPSNSNLLYVWVYFTSFFDIGWIFSNKVKLRLFNAWNSYKSLWYYFRSIVYEDELWDTILFLSLLIFKGFFVRNKVLYELGMIVSPFSIEIIVLAGVDESFIVYPKANWPALFEPHEYISFLSIYKAKTVFLPTKNSLTKGILGIFSGFYL